MMKQKKIHKSHDTLYHYKQKTESVIDFSSWCSYSVWSPSIFLALFNWISGVMIITARPQGRGWSVSYDAAQQQPRVPAVMAALACHTLTYCHDHVQPPCYCWCTVDCTRTVHTTTIVNSKLSILILNHIIKVVFLWTLKT